MCKTLPAEMGHDFGPMLEQLFAIVYVYVHWLDVAQANVC